MLVQALTYDLEPLFRRLAYPLARCRDDHDDLVQEARIGVWDAVEHYGCEHSALRPLAFVSGRRRMWRAWRSRLRFETGLIELTPEELERAREWEDRSDPDWPVRLAPPVADSRSDLEIGILVGELHGLLHGMDRELFARLVAGQTGRDIGRSLGLRDAQVYGGIRRIRKTLTALEVFHA